MPDHIHWLLQLCDVNLSNVIKRFKGRSARAINQHTKNQGTIWQKGFHDHALRSNEGLKTTARYIVANPLRAGLVSNIQDYPFWWAVWTNKSADLFE